MPNEDNKKSTSKSKTDLLIIALKRHRFSFFIVLLMLSVSTVLAWFIYNYTVDFTMKAHVKAWNIMLGDQEGEGEAVFSLSDIYPGVSEFSFDGQTTCTSAISDNCVLITNNGELSANASLVVKSFTLFGEEQELGTDYTLSGPDEDGIYTISGEYPFSIRFKMSSVTCSEYDIDGTTCLSYVTTLEPGKDVSLFFSFKWPYEKDDYDTECGDSSTLDYCKTEDAYTEYYDELDTYYGEKSYEYKSEEDADSDKKSLIITLTIDFVQINE